MGQKVHPRGYRLGITTAHKSRWYADNGKNGQSYSDYVQEDIAIRRLINKKYVTAGISKVEIERKGKDVVVDVFAGRSGTIIGKSGTGVESMRAWLAKNLKKSENEIRINVVGMDNPLTNAQLVAQRVAEDLVRRVTFRRAMKKAIEGVQSAGYGVKIMCSGRLGGAEMARSEFYREGSVPLHTLRAYVDYGFFEAHTTYGRIGVKVWIYKGEITEHEWDLQSQRARNKKRPAGTRPSSPVAPAAPVSAAHVALGDDLKPETVEADIDAHPVAVEATAPAEVSVEPTVEANVETVEIKEGE